MATSSPEQDPPEGGSEPTVVESLQPVIQDLPQPKQQEITRTVERTIEHQMMAVFRGGMGPQMDPETAKILATTIEKDNDNKFKYLTQKQSDIAARETREHTYSLQCHTDGISLLRPIIYSSIVIVITSVVSGIYFISHGQEAVGSSLLTGVFGLLFGYLGGLGSSNYMATGKPE